MVYSEKVKVSKDQFAEVLYRWLSKFLTDKAIKKSAKDLGFKLRRKNYSKVFGELFVLYMWLIVYTCEDVLEDENKRNECLDIFHHLVYKRHTEGTEEDFGKWLKSVGAKYIEYYKAMETDHPSGPLWVVASLVNKKLFGKIKEDAWLQLRIVGYVESFVKYLRKAIKQYDIE